MNRILKLAQWISISTFILTKMLLKWLFNRWGKKETSNFKNQFLSWWNLWYSLTFYVKVGFPCCYGIPLSFGTTSNIFLFVFTMKPFLFFITHCFWIHCYLVIYDFLTPCTMVILVFWWVWHPVTSFFFFFGWLGYPVLSLYSFVWWGGYLVLSLYSFVWWGGHPTLPSYSFVWCSGHLLLSLYSFVW